MSASLILGGPLAIACPSCREEVGNECRTRPGGRGGFHTTKPHAARVKAASPIVEAHVGDLVLVRYRGERVAQLVDIGVVLTVRFWRPSAQVFASPRLLEREAVIGLAPDDARTALAREELRGEQLPREVRPRLHFEPSPGTITIAGLKIADVCDVEIDGRRVGGRVTKLDGEGRVAEVELATPPALASDIAEGRGPFDPVISHITPDEIRRLDALGHIASDPSPTTPDAPPDPWFTSDSAPTTAPPKGW